MSKTIEELEQQQADTQAAPPAPPETPGAPGSPEGGSPAGQTPVTIELEELGPMPVLRPAIAVGTMVLGTSFLIGGMFTGVTPRIYAAVATLLGVGLATWAITAEKRKTLVQILSIAGLAVAGALGLVLVGFDSISKMPDLISEAVSNAQLRRPPAAFDAGWRVLLIWTVGGLAYAATYIAIAMRRPIMGIMLPMPAIVFAAIAQPPELQLAGGIVALVGFVVALAVLFRPSADERERMPLSFELRRAAKTAPMVVGLIVALLFLGQTDLLFPDPLYDPTQKAILPKATPLSETVDRVLFTVKSTATGPWRTGVLDVYDGEAWRLPPFSASSFEPIPDSGILDQSISPGNRARFEIAELEGTVLPAPPRSQAIVGKLPDLVTDDRSDTLRVETGQVEPKIAYDIAFGVLPAEEELNTAAAPSAEMQEFLEVPDAPRPIQRLIDEAEGTPWQKLDAVRSQLLDTVASSGSGLPVAVPPSKVEDMFFGSQEGTPFEIVAAQALLARWAGVPSRIGFGFDGGEEIAAETREVRPKHGSMWLEVHFDGHGWLPVTGLPKQARKNLNSDEVQLEQNLVPSGEIGVELFLPLRLTPGGQLFRTIQNILLVVIPLALLVFLGWLAWPLLAKYRRRVKMRAWARETGPEAQVAVAYAEFRDLATDLGVGDPYATPLAFLKQVVPDQEHTELAWLITRSLWGDLRGSLTIDDVHAAEELARSLRRRVFEGQPFTIRVIALLSRLSLRTPYSPELLPAKTSRIPSLKRKKKELTHASA